MVAVEPERSWAPVPPRVMKIEATCGSPYLVNGSEVSAALPLSSRLPGMLWSVPLIGATYSLPRVGFLEPHEGLRFSFGLARTPGIRTLYDRQQFMFSDGQPITLGITLLG